MKANTCTCDIVTLRPAADVRRRAVVTPVTGVVRSCPGREGPIGVVVKISHSLGIQINDVATPHRRPKRVLDLDGVADPGS